MKYFYLIAAIILIGCSSNSGAGDNNTNNNSDIDSDCGEYRGHKLHKGERGGCYYKHHNKKEYVDHSYCNCL
jgi:hypothetical protein